MLWIVVLFVDPIKIKSSFLSEAARFLFKIQWNFLESIIPCMRTILPGPSEEKQPHITNTPPYLPIGNGCFSLQPSLFPCIPALSIGVRAKFLFRLIAQLVQEAYGKLQVLACDNNIGNASFWHTNQSVCWHGDNILWGIWRHGEYHNL